MITVTVGLVRLLCNIENNHLSIGDGEGNSVVGACPESINISVYDNITCINSCAFINSTMRFVVLGKHITSIGHSAFKNCEKLEEVDLKDTKIGTLSEMIFYGCKSLKNVTLPPNLIDIQSYSLACTSISSLLINDSVMYFCGSSIYQCYNLKTITVKSDYLFKKDNIIFSKSGTHIIAVLPILKQFDYNENVNHFDNHCCEGSLIESVHIKKHIISIGYYSFSDCKNLKKIIIDDGVTEIFSFAFKNVNAISITVPPSLCYMLESCFKESLLENINLSSSSASILYPYSFSNCYILDRLVLPHNLKQIRSYAFANTPKLVELEIPSSLNMIHPFAFEYSSIKYLNLSHTKIKSLSCNALSSYVLSSVTLPRYLVRMDNHVFRENHLKIEYLGVRNFSQKCQINADVIVGFAYPSDLFCGTRVTRPKKRVPIHTELFNTN